MTIDQFNRHKERLKRLIELGRNLIGEIPFDHRDDWHFLQFCFLGKQVQHTENILKLNGDRDAWIVGKAMLEGYFQWLHILANDTRELSERWRAFVLVSDWRKKKKRIERGESIGQPTSDEIDGLLQGYSGEFLTEQARKALGEGKPLPEDPYVNNWLGKSVREIFFSLASHGIDQKDIDRFYNVYNHFSEWSHWSVAGVGRGIRTDEHGLITSWVTGAKEEYFEVIKIAFMCLIKLEIGIASQFKPDLLSKLNQIEQEYLSEFGTT
jgi:hypothetical protein